MKWYKKPTLRWRQIVTAGCAIALFYAFITHIGVFGKGIASFWNVCLPVIWGLIIAYIFNPLVKLFQRTLFKKMRRRHLARIFSVFLSMILFVFLIVLLLVFLIPQLLDSVLTFAQNLDGYVDSLQALLSTLSGSASGSGLDISQLVSTGNDLLDKVGELLPNNLDSWIKNITQIGGNLIMLVISFIMSIYFLIDKESLVKGLRRLFRLLLPEKSYRSASAFWGRLNSVLVRYIVCELLDALFVGVTNFIFMAIAGLPYGVLISVVVGVTNLAPTFGPIVGGVIGAFILVLVNPWYALWFIIFTIILQTIDGYVVKPKFYGSALQIPSILVLASIIIFGRMLGVVGILIAIPIAAMISYAYTDAFLPWLTRRRAKKDNEAAKAKTVKAEAEEEEEGNDSSTTDFDEEPESEPSMGTGEKENDAAENAEAREDNIKK
jgi:predicted PurR-regulated permease PerM